MEIILGSSSPRRELILKNIYPAIIITPPSISEVQKLNEKAETFAQRISYEKALDVYYSLKKTIHETLLITADTIVTIDSKILGKPQDLDDARNMLRLLSGNKHRVISGLTLMFINNNKYITRTATEETAVLFKNITDNDIDKYLGLIDYKDKAGSYACQEYGEIIIQNIEGSLSNVIGFPLRLYFKLLTDMGIMNKAL